MELFVNVVQLIPIILNLPPEKPVTGVSIPKKKVIKIIIAIVIDNTILFRTKHVKSKIIGDKIEDSGYCC